MEAHPRYLEPKRGPSEAAIRAMTPTRESFPVNPAFASVQPRFREPRASTPTPRGSEFTFDVRNHIEFVNNKYSDLRPRYMPDKPKNMENSPRRQVEKKLEEQKRERVLWRGDTVSGKYTTFDDLMKQTKKIEESVPKPKTITAPSRVAQYLLHGTASHPYQNNEQQTKRRTPAREGSPNRTQRHWHSGGVDNLSFEKRQRETSNRTWFISQEKRVKELNERRNSLSVPADFTPRVASLSIAEKVKAELSNIEHSAQPLYFIGEDVENQPSTPRSTTPVLRLR